MKIILGSQSKGRRNVLKKYVEKTEGDIDSIMGLPKALTERLIKEVKKE